MQPPDPEFQAIALPSPEGPALWLGAPRNALAPGARLIARFDVSTTPGLRRALADRIGPYASIRLDEQCCLSVPDLLPQIKTALVKLSGHDTLVDLVDVSGARLAAIGDPALARQLNELRQAIAALKRLTRLRPQDSLRARWQGRALASANKPGNFAVLGAGIAGVTLALELLRRGKRVTLVEARSEVLDDASGQPTLVCHPQFSRDQDMLSQLTQLALRLTLDSPYAALFMRSGRLTPALSQTQAQAQRALVRRLDLPADLLRFVEAREAAVLAQWPPAKNGVNDAGEAPHDIGWGGLWTALGASLPVPLLREHVRGLASLEHTGLRVLAGHSARTIQWRDGLWQLEVVSGRGASALQADGLVIAAGSGIPGMIRQLTGPGVPPGFTPLPGGWEEMGGQTFRATSPQLQIPRAAPTIGGPVTFQRIAPDTMVLGSSYYEPDAAPPDHAQWQAVLQKLAQLPGMSDLHLQCQATYPGVRCYTPDRMPLIGPLLNPPLATGSPAQAPASSLWLAGAFGSRGLLWAHLAAQLIADQIEGKAPVAGLKALKSIDALRYLTQA